MARKRVKKICIEIPECHILSAVSVLNLSDKDEESVDVIEKELHQRKSINIDLPRMLKEEGSEDLRILPVMLGLLSLMQIAYDIDIKKTTSSI